MLPSLTALTKTFQTGATDFSKITKSKSKSKTTKSNLQQISDKQKSLMLLRTGLKNRLQS